MSEPTPDPAPPAASADPILLVDAHTHVAASDTERFPFKPADINTSKWWHRDASADHLISVFTAAGVDRACAVQGISAYGYDCRAAIHEVATHPDRLALVGAVDMDEPDPAAGLRALAGEAPMLRGVRLFGVGGAAPVWLTDGRAEAVWRAAADAGVNLVPVLWPRDLPALRPLLEAHPDVAVALDHCCFPDLSGGRPFPDARPLFDLAGLDALYLKVSSHLLHDAAEVGDPADLVDELFSVFGAGRMCWGSDFPQTQMPYPEMLALARRAARNLPPAEHQSFFSGVALQLWWP